VKVLQHNSRLGRVALDIVVYCAVILMVGWWLCQGRDKPTDYERFLQETQTGGGVADTTKYVSDSAAVEKEERPQFVKSNAGSSSSCPKLTILPRTVTATTICVVSILLLRMTWRIMA